MTHPSVKRAFLMRLINDAMREAGYSEPSLSGAGYAVYMAPKYRSGYVRIAPPTGLADTCSDLFGLAQTLIDHAIRYAEQEAA